MENYIELFTSNSSIILLFGLSFLGGLVASISPCSLAMLPIIIGYVGGYSEEKPFKTFNFEKLKDLKYGYGSRILYNRYTVCNHR